MMFEKINIGIAEDHTLVRHGFIKMLEPYPAIKVLFEVSNGKELLANLKKYKPSVILLDIKMEIMDGLEAMAKIKERHPKMKIIVVSGFSEPNSVLKYVKMGANSFLDKKCSVDMLLNAIHAVNEGKDYFDEQTSKLLIKHGVFPQGYNPKRELTQKEIVVLKLLCNNEPHDAIATLMGIKEHSVDWYRHILWQKTNSKSMADLIKYAKENNLI